MKLKTIFAAGCISTCLLFTGGFSWAAGSGGPKIGYFEMNTVLQQSQWGKRAGEELKRQRETLKSDLDQKGKGYKTAKEELDKKKGVWDEKTRAKKEAELRDIQQELEKNLMDAQTKDNKLGTELMGPVFDKAVEAVRKIGKEDKYDFVFEREKAGIVFVNEKEDLTKRIIAEVDKSAPR